MVRFYSCLCMTVACAVPAYAKPIAFSEGTTAMLEHGAGTMQEIQVFYAPRFNYSIGGGHLDLDSDMDGKTRHITYARINWLVHRWNQPSAQANLFVWGGAGSATGNTFEGSRSAINAGVQADYETRRVYTSLKSEFDRSSAFSHRIDTLQVGVAPYKHDYEGLATWFVLQARQYTGGLHSGVESAALLRLFKGGAWIEAGVTNGGKLQAMAMFNF